MVNAYTEHELFPTCFTHMQFLHRVYSLVLSQVQNVSRLGHTSHKVGPTLGALS